MCKRVVLLTLNIYRQLHLHVCRLYCFYPFQALLIKLEMNSSLLVSDSVFINVSESKFKFHDYSADDTKFDITSVDDDDSQLDSSIDKQKNFCNKNIESVPITMTREEAMKLVNIAASLLQVNIKRYLQQKKFKVILLRHKSAIKIQAVWRGYSVRILNKKVIEKFKYELPIKILQQCLNYQDIMHQKSLQAVLMNQESLVAAVYALTCEVENLKMLAVHSEKQSNFSSEHFPFNIKKYNNNVNFETNGKNLVEQNTDDMPNVKYISTMSDVNYSSLNFSEDFNSNVESKNSNLETILQEVNVPNPDNDSNTDNNGGNEMCPSLNLSEEINL